MIFTSRWMKKEKILDFFHYLRHNFLMKPKELIPTEHQEQALFFQLARTLRKEFPELDYLLFAIPNGGKRYLKTALLLKEEGVKSGVPDIFCAMPKNGEHGLWIEMKRSRGGTVSKSQKLMREMLRAQNYRVVVANKAEKAFAALKAYLYGTELPNE